MRNSLSVSGLKVGTVLRALQSGMGRETVLQTLRSRLEGENASLCFRFDTGIRNDKFLKFL
ncbi:hypothetical protein C1645_814979 [Glomus cerebriforme]|uniref:Uncharacterized protein n=1 Tax=Glomus cerebriforme TaxID=658196 RepID=A0A397TJY7_9GLOM|nr:hypothetical protein C1645_814979 [Glomus cerebriforme]